MRKNAYCGEFRCGNGSEKISAGDLAKAIDITPANLSVLKNGKAKAVRFTTLEALCKALECQPGDILEYVSEE